MARCGVQIKHFARHCLDLNGSGARERCADTMRFCFGSGFGVIVFDHEGEGESATRPGTREVGMELGTSKEPFARARSAGTGSGRPDRPAWSGQSRSMSFTLGIVSAAVMAISPAFAGDSATCSMLAKLLEATDRGLEAAAAGDARGATSGIAVFAQQTQDMANRYSQIDMIPDAVIAALTAILEETATQYFIADAAPVLLKQALVIQQTMPDICAGLEIPDLRRHVN